MSLPKLVYIHGANASSESFTFIRDKITGFEEIVIDYSTATSFSLNLRMMKQELKKEKGPFFFIGHSLGGIYSLHLADEFKDQVKGAVTISTPYKGSAIADIIKHFLPHVQLLKDIGPTAQPIAQSLKIKVKWDWTNVVTTKGHCLWLRQPNDGVVTIESMKRPDIKLVEVPLNHYEVVVSRKTVNIIVENLEKIC